MATIRLFIAIELTDQLLEGLAAVQEGLRQDEWTDDIRWVRPEGIHLTLKFLGEVAEERVDEIHEALRQAAAGVSPFSITVGGLGAFPNFRNPRVVWIGVGGELAPLQKLQERVEQAMAGLGFEPEGRPFHPHLTLGRVNRRASSGYRRRLGEALQTYPFGDVGRMRVEALSLMRSQLHPKGAIYTELGIYPLKGKD